MGLLMTFLVAVLAFAAGIAVGATAAWYLLRGSAARTAAPAPAPVEPPAAAVAAAERLDEAVPTGEQAAENEDLRPVLEATRGVVSALEERYQGARAEGDEDGAARSSTARAASRKPRAPRRRT